MADTQDPKNITTSGHENHGVHLCRKCGWSFPNPHPSAKQRRAHKRNCGKIEGYKLIHSEENSHLNVSDDDHLSDEDPKTPSPKIMKRSEFGSGRVGESSNRSEDDVFSDAVAEFSDTGAIPGTKEHKGDARGLVSHMEKVADDDKSKTISVKDSDATEIIQPPNCSTGSSQMQHPEVLEHTSNLLENTNTQPDDLEQSSTFQSIPSSISDSGMEFVPSDDTRDSKHDLYPMETSTMDATQVTKNSIAGEDVAMPSSTIIVAESDVRKDGENDLEGNLLVSRSERAREAYDAGHKLEETNRNASDALIADGIVLLKEEESDRLGTEISSNDISPEVESNVHLDNPVDTAQIQANTPCAADFVSGSVTIEGCETEGEGNSYEDLSLVSGGMPEVIHPEVMVERYDDHKELNLKQPVALDSSGADREEEDDKKPVSEVNIPSSQLTESLSIPSNKDNPEGGSGQLMIQGVPIEEEPDILGIKYETDEKLLADNLGVPADKARTDVEKSQTTSSREEQASQTYGNDLPEKIMPENTTSLILDSKPMISLMETDLNQTIKISVHGDDAGDQEKAITGKCDIEDDNFQERVTGETHTKNRETIPETGISPYGSESDKTANLISGDNASDNEKVELGVCSIGKCESTEGVMEENVTMNPKSTPDFAGNLSEFQVAEDGMDKSVGCAETVSTYLDQVSDSNRVDINEIHLVGTNSNPQNCLDEAHQHAEEPEISSSNKVELAGSVDTMTELNHNSDAQLIQKTSVMNELLVSTVEVAPVQSSVTVEDEHIRVLDGDASGILSKSLPEHGDKDHSKQQPGVTANDISVDSSSQTDSLEGHWGSISDATILSMVSDVPAVVDSEALSSTGSLAMAEAKKANTREGHNSHGSDMFEPPSFLTLVEPRGGADLKVATSEIQTLPNPQQSNPTSTQPGWFPSLTHVANDSQGRKKNEEIIAKVNNWTAGKQHTPLKSLLGEANAETKQKSSSNPKEKPTAVVQKDGNPAKNNGALVLTVNSIKGPNAPVSQASKVETGQEWNSPARYPAEIKREKRKGKGKPYWVQLVCCSSVN